MDRISKTKSITNIAVGVAAIIGGGFAIFQFSNMVPLPGMKYILMAPYLSLTLYILLMRINTPYAMLRISSVFGIIMLIINSAMGLSILTIGVLAQLTMIPIKDKRIKNTVGSIVFAGYSAPVGLGISRLILKGYFEEVSLTWVIIAFLISTVSGVLGTYVGSKMIHLIRRGV